MNYLDFDLLLEHSGDDCRAKVLNSPAGQAEHNFHLPFSDLEIENYLLKFGRSRRGTRRLDSINIEVAKSFGKCLFEAVFDEEVRDAFYRSLDEAERQDAGLRLRLRLTSAPDLADLPWEYLYNPSDDHFLCLSERTSLIRYLDLPMPIRPLAVKPPIKILVMISNPVNYPPLAVGEEWLKLKETLGILENQKHVTLERLEKATLAELQNRLGRRDYHVFHFIGHGGYDQRTREGGLVMEDDYGQARLVGGKLLGALLRDERTLRLALLNACEGARGSRQDLFAGPAQSLMQHGIPAVLAMQFEIKDEVAITFAREFYAALAQGQSLEAALADARKKIFFQGNELEWAAPVLYLRAPDGKIFNVKIPPRASKPKTAANNQALHRIYSAHMRLSLLFFLNGFSEDFPGLNITALCRALNVRKRKFAVRALKKLADEGLVEKMKTGKSVRWVISKTGREALHTLAGWIDTKMQVPQGRH